MRLHTGRGELDAGRAHGTAVIRGLEAGAGRGSRVRGLAPVAVLVAMAAALAAWPGAADAQSLRGGSRSMQEQSRKAHEYDYTPLRNASHVNRFVELGLLVPLRGNADYRLHQVSFPYARPEVRMFVERLASQYRGACGEELVVTSLTRPKNRQPRNSSPLSVHPMGMAVDLRRSNVRACRAWLESVLLQLEGAGAVQATRERRPPHYHIAVYTREYAAYVDRLESSQGRNAGPTRMAEAPAGSGASGRSAIVRHEVRAGDSLWSIARAYGTTVDEIVRSNNLRDRRKIIPGQVLEFARSGSR